MFGLHRMSGREKSKASPATSPMGRDNKHGWYEEHEKFVAIATRSLSSVLLVGDSMVKGLARYHRVWSKYFEPLRALNFGVGGDRTQHVLWRIENGEIPLNLQVAFVHCGTNNLDRHNPAEIRDGIASIKSRISNLVHNAFRKKDGSVRYTHIKLTRAKGYFTHDINGGGDNMFTADSICEMIEFLIDNIFVQFGGRLFRQVIGIPMGTNCAPLLADLFLYSYENEFLDNMIRSGHRRLARSFNLCYRYTDDLIVFNNKKFLDYLKEIYPSQLTVEKANKSDHLADYLDLTFIIDSGGKLSTRLYDKRDDFDFHIVNFPFLSSNIPSGPSYGVYISQLIRYA